MKKTLKALATFYFYPRFNGVSSRSRFLLCERRRIEEEVRMIRRTTPLSVLVVLVWLLVGANAWAATLALHASDGTVDKSDPQNGTGDLATANAAIGESFNELGESRGFVVFDTTGIGCNITNVWPVGVRFN